MKIELENAVVYAGSNLDVLPTLPDSSVDSIVTDPPYELGFMGKSWDNSGIAYSVELWTECMRVLKPGGHLLAFGGSRTWHRLAVAIEDAGFEMRDSIAWLYGSGFPKSMDISKQIEKRARGCRVIELIDALLETGLTLSEIGEKANIPSLESSYRDWTQGGHAPEERSWERMLDGLGFSENDGLDVIARKKVTLGGGNAYSFREGEKRDFTVKKILPNTEEAKQWQGWGTALKPAFEPVVVARKPLEEKTVAANVLKFGTGGLNIDGSRIATDEVITNHSRSSEAAISQGKFGDSSAQETHQTDGQKLGRWPANIILDPYTAELLDEQSGHLKSGKIEAYHNQAGKEAGIYGEIKGLQTERGYGDTGGASRFFYVAKASKKDRNEGLDHLEVRKSDQRSDTAAGLWADMEAPKQNFHPTVKPTALMEYLIKLVTPPNGTVLDPFTGSGSTGKAALLSGFKFIGIELTEEYLPIIEGRLKWAIEQASKTEEEKNEVLF